MFAPGPPGRPGYEDGQLDKVTQYADLRLGGTEAGLMALAEPHREHRIATLNHRYFTVDRPIQAEAFTVLS